MYTNNNFDKKRFEAFIDAIIAILLTILVLEIKLPAQADNESLLNIIKSLFPLMVSFIATFVLMIGFWIDYHVLFLNIKYITKQFILVNMLFILSFSLLPFITGFAIHNSSNPNCVALLSLCYFITNLFFSFIYWYARSNNLANPEFWKQSKKNAWLSIIVLLLLLGCIPLSYYSVPLTYTVFISGFSAHLLKKS